MWFTIGDSQYMIHNMWFTIKLCILDIKTIFWNLGRKWRGENGWGDFGGGKTSGEILAGRFQPSAACLSEPCIWGTFCSTQAQNPKKQIRLGKYVSASIPQPHPNSKIKKVNGLSESTWAYLKLITSTYIEWGDFFPSNQP